MSKRKVSPGAREHNRTDKMMQLAASFLAQHIGYLKVESLPGSAIFNRLPTRSVDANKVVRLQNELAVVKQGLVEVRHVAYDKLVTNLKPGALFGEMPLLGQSMFGTSALAGPTGSHPCDNGCGPGAEVGEAEFARVVGTDWFTTHQS